MTRSRLPIRGVDAAIIRTPHASAGRRHPLAWRLVLEALMLCALGACGTDPVGTEAPEIYASVFPQHFMWGAAGSAHQTEGDDSASDWWKWELDGRTVSG